MISLPAGSLSGELGLIGLFDLGQLLMLNGATGCLSITLEDGKGHLYLEGGRIVNAVDDRYREGEEAAYRIFTWKRGKFEFKPEAPGGMRTIDVASEALMLEAARRMDEAGAEEGAEPGGETARLIERQGSLEALRDAFRSALRDVGQGSPGSGPLDWIVDPSDRLVLRPGRPPRLRRNGAWSEPAPQPLEVPAYESLKALLLGGGGIPVPLRNGGAARATEVRSGAGRGLWVRPVEIPAPDPRQLDGPVPALEAALDLAPGVVLVGAADRADAERMFHALIAALTLTRAETVALVSETSLHRHDDAAGLVVVTQRRRLRRVLAEVTPEVIAFDYMPRDFAAIATEVQHARLVVVRVDGDAIDEVYERWRAALAGEGLAPILARETVVVVALPPDRPGHLPFHAAGIDGDQSARAA